MYITIEDALSIHPFSKAKIIAGAKGATRVITSINVMDSPEISNWVRPGEMLLTTASIMNNEIERLCSWLRALDEQGCSALGIKLGQFATDIPQVVIDEADSLNFPLIALPCEYNLSEIVIALFQENYERNTKQLQHTLEKQKNLIRFAMHHKGNERPFQMIANIIDYPIAVIGGNKQIIYNTIHLEEEQLLQDWPWKITFSKKTVDGSWLCRIPLMREDECYGYLLVTTKQEPLKQEDDLFLQAAEIVSYLMGIIPEEEQSMESYRIASMIDKYLSGKITGETFHEQMNAIDPDLLSQPNLCVLTLLDADRYSEDHVHRTLQRFRRDIQFHPQLGVLHSYHLFVGEELFSIFTVPEEQTSSSFTTMVAKSYSELLQSIGSGSGQSFISKIKQGLLGLTEAYDECVEAKRLSRSLSYSDNTILFSNLEFTYLFRHIPRQVMSNYCNNILLPFRNKDEGYVEEMRQTLEAYFMNQGQVSETAKQLYVHRNTVLYRLERISEQLNIDFKKIEDVLRMKLVLMFQQLMEMDVLDELSTQ